MEYSIRYEVLIEVNGKTLMDSRLANLLKQLRSKGSLLAASKALNIPYSRAWEMIVKAERVLGKPLIETSRGGRGGGGTRLTREALELLEIYERAESKMRRCGLPRVVKYGVFQEPDLVIAYSHDPVLELLMGELVRSGYSVEGLCIGSSKALSALSLGEADIACTHLFDPVTSEYNKPFIEKQWFCKEAVFLGGYKRELVLAYHPSIEIRSLRDAFQAILTGELRVACRNKGSGTRIYFDYLVNKMSSELGLDEIRIVGCDREHYTHYEVVRSIAGGKADIGLTLRYVAEAYGLKTLTVTWERYECVSLREKIEREPVKAFSKLLRKNKLERFISGLNGYDVLN